MRLNLPQCVFNVAAAFFFAAACVSSFAQSSDQNFPTALTSSEIRGTIMPRAIGDARETTHYYLFDGEQGDLFINVATKNLAGSIDVFSSDTVRTFTRIPIFAESATVETGRVIYLRKNERMLLRVQGRTPDDNPATYQIKFAGGFLAIANPQQDAVAVPTLSRPSADSAARSSDDRGAEKTEKAQSTAVNVEAKKPIENAEAEESESRREIEARPRQRRSPPRVVVSDPVVAEEKKATPQVRTSRASRRTTPATRPEPKVEVPDALANVRLVIELKSGEIIERSMPELLRFSVDRGVLVVIARDGTIRRYPLTEVAKITLQ